MRRGKAIGLFLLLLLVGSIGLLNWLTYQQARQDALNRTLIAAIQRADAPAGVAALEAGADPNSRKDTSKPLSFWQSLRRLFAGLWKHDKTGPAQSGQTALPLALGVDAEVLRSPTVLSPLIRVLVAKGANVNARDHQGNTPLILAVKWEPADIVRALLDKGAEVNARNNDGRTALMEAVGTDKADIVKALLARGAEVNARDNSGRTALIDTAMSGFMATLPLLLAKGADVNAQGYGGRTALMWAANNADIEVVNLLLAQGARIDIRDDQGNTALMDALYGHGMRPIGPSLYAVVTSLLRHGASVHIKNSDGESALSYVSSLQEKPLLQLLKQAGAKE